MQGSELQDLFCNLVSIPSPSGKEADVAKLIKSELRTRGISFREDKAAGTNNSNSGNIIATVPGGKQKLIFIAHMDTVEAGNRRIKPIIRNGVIRSDGNTILGADNKAGVAPLICALGEISKMKERPTVIGVFSTREEEGWMGVNALPKGNGREFVFALDSEGNVGEFINKALGSTLFDVEIRGKEAHAALNPEKGANAIKAAGLIISSLKLGKRPHDSILNVGMVSGGRKRNVIPGSAVLKFGTRAFDTGTMEATIREVDAVARKACKATGCTYSIKRITDDGEPPFAVKPNEAVFKVARLAASRAGLRFSVTKRMATFEANVLSHKGYRPLVMCHGGMQPHSTSEWIRASDLSDTEKLIVEITKAALSLR